MQNNENSIPFVPVTNEAAVAAGSPADQSRRFDLTQNTENNLEDEREIELENKVNAATNFEELANVFGEFPHHIKTSQGPQNMMDVVINPIVELRNFYTSLAKEKQPRPEVAIIEEMIRKITRMYNLRNKVGELVTKELDVLFS